MLSTLLTLALLGTPPMPLPLQGTYWTLTSINPRGTEEFKLGPYLTQPTLSIQGARASGSTGCSPLKANVNVQGSTIRFTGIDAGSDKRCTDHALSLRGDLTDLLRDATSYEIKDGTLILHAGPRQLTFSALTLPNLSGNWQVTRLVLNGKTVPVGQDARLTLTHSGTTLRLSGSLGCNQLGANGTLQGQVVNFGGLTSTRMMCPPDRMQGEMALGQLLRGPVSLQASGNSLTWTAKDGSLTLLRHSATSQNATLQGAYTLVSINGKAPPQMNRPATVEFQGGKVNGSDGCNLYGASYQLVGSQINLTTPAMSTLMACPENGEVPLPDLLGKQPTFSLSGNTLTLRAGAEVWVFQAK